jgi:hypothetical protein
LVLTRPYKRLRQTRTTQLQHLQVCFRVQDRRLGEQPPRALLGGHRLLRGALIEQLRQTTLAQLPSHLEKIHENVSVVLPDEEEPDVKLVAERLGG